MEESKLMNIKDKDDLQSDKGREYLFKLFKAEMDKQKQKIIRVYSFRPISDYLINDLCYGQLSCSPVSSFNDPLDCPLFSFLEKGKTLCETYNLDSTPINELYDAAQNLKVRCFVADSKNVTTNTLMWAHYANSHKGVLLCYEIPSILENDENKISFLKKVKYSNSFNGVRLISLSDKSTSKDTISMVTTKNKAWSYENEIRLLHFSKNTEIDYPKIKIEKTCLKKIYFGAYVDECDKLKIEILTRHYPDLQLYQIGRSPNNLIQLKCIPYTIEDKNLLDYNFIRDMPLEINSFQDEEWEEKRWPIGIESCFRGEVDELIITTNSLEEVLLKYDKLSEQSKVYIKLYVLLYQKDKSKLSWEPETEEDVHVLAKEIIGVYYNSHRDIHKVREHLGISHKFLTTTEIG